MHRQRGWEAHSPWVVVTEKSVVEGKPEKVEEEVQEEEVQEEEVVVEPSAEVEAGRRGHNCHRRWWPTHCNWSRSGTNIRTEGRHSFLDQGH